jgi:cytochrome b6-f complex iron-sulfur subunit
VKIEDSYLARRRFLCGLLGGGVAAMAGGAAVPLAQYAGDFRKDPPPPFLEIAEADCRLAPGKSKLLMYGPIPVLLLQPPEPQSQLKIFVATCTHLNCTVCYQEENNRIYCACHEGAYDTSGQVLAGPPPEPLREFYWMRRNGKLIIALEKENLEKST